MTAKEFKAITGHYPRQDDLVRANCLLNGGELGHQQCGLCPHGMPRSIPCKKCTQTTLDLRAARFEGPADNAKDFDRLCNQLERIHDLMIDGAWRTLAEIESITGDPQASISAQLRHLRKHRFGAHEVEKQRRKYPSRNGLDSGTWEYQVKGGLCAE